VAEDVRQIPDGADEDGVGRAHSPIAAAVLETSAYDADIVEPQLANGALQEPGLFFAGLEEDHRRARPYDRERDPRETSAASHIEERGRGRLEEGERVEGVEDVARVDGRAVPIGDQGEGSGRVVDETPILQ